MSHTSIYDRGLDNRNSATESEEISINLKLKYRRGKPIWRRRKSNSSNIVDAIYKSQDREALHVRIISQICAIFAICISQVSKIAKKGSSDACRVSLETRRWIVLAEVAGTFYKHGGQRGPCKSLYIAVKRAITEAVAFQQLPSPEEQVKSRYSCARYAEIKSMPSRSCSIMISHRKSDSDFSLQNLMWCEPIIALQSCNILRTVYKRLDGQFHKVDPGDALLIPVCLVSKSRTKLPPWNTYTVCWVCFALRNISSETGTARAMPAIYKSHMGNVPFSDIYKSHPQCCWWFMNRQL